jgi:predicted dehydrogenase
MTRLDMTRRDLLRTGLAGGVIAALPASVYQSAFADDTPSERVRVGSIGTGNQGGPNNNLKHFVKNVVALCDLDTRHLATAAAFVEKAGTKPDTYADYRKLLERKDIDAVVVTVPDHWHALITVDACKAGKDVYCEKPLTLTIAEGPAMVTAARKHKRVVQTGTQQRSGREFKTACELVRGGAVGKVHTVKVGLPKPNWTDRAKVPVPDSKPPAELDYQMWLGPAPERAYNRHRVHYLFRFFWDYSGGQQTNFGAHHLDIAQWGLGMDESGPVTVEGVAKYHPQGWYETPDHTEITYTYANGVTMHCGQSHPGGTTFIGDKGTLYVTRGKLTADPKDILKDVDQPKGKGGWGDSSATHTQNFLACVKSRQLPVADVAVGHRSATVCHLGNIAVRLGRKLTWDPVKETFVADSEAAKWVSKEYRKPWAL